MLRNRRAASAHKHCAQAGRARGRLRGTARRVAGDSAGRPGLPGGSCRCAPHVGCPSGYTPAPSLLPLMLLPAPAPPDGKVTYQVTGVPCTGAARVSGCGPGVHSQVEQEGRARAQSGHTALVPHLQGGLFWGPLGGGHVLLFRL